MPGLRDLEPRYVRPFYLTMMGLNALSYQVPYDALRDLAQEITDDEVATLFAADWRPRVMGAWLAAGRAQRLESSLLASLQTSAGSLTAPPLAIVALHGLAARAVPSLETCLQHDTERQLGSASFLAAVLELAGARPADIAIDDRHRTAAGRMLAVADRLANA